MRRRPLPLRGASHERALRPVTWNRNKLIYDAVLIAGVFIYIWIFLKYAPDFQTVTRSISGTIYKARAFGSCAFLMLSFILCLGPLARLDSRFLPLLYNRRHLGVLTCSVALVHASYVIAVYFASSPYYDKYVAVLGTNTNYGQFLGFPFESLGILAVTILVIMAVTSHDFWLKFLSPPLWKGLHMLVYLAYLSAVAHVGLGALQAQTGPFMPMIVGMGVAAVAGLHFVAALRERREAGMATDADETWLVAGELADIPDNRALIVPLGNEQRAAVVRYDGKLSAVSNVCAHQNGPLGEGRILWGCVTCPWHGFQYNPADGRAPAPFTEKIPTFRIKLEGTRVLIDPVPLPAGTYVEPIVLEEA